MASSLTTADFGAFFGAVNDEHDHGANRGSAPRRPFPWQERLVELVIARAYDPSYSGQIWPRLVDLPTGAGKSSLVDIALFCLALEAERPLPERRVPRRIVFVVDRRVVVDQAHRRARLLSSCLSSAREGILGTVASRLKSYSGDDGSPPVVATVLRGGIVRDETWARRPDVPAVISSTVDQAGSRLLFRGYGLSAGMRPIHAGLLGNDTLFVLDEVHLSQAFARTLTALGEDYQTRWAEVRVPARWEVTQLSATPASAPDDAFRLGPDDLDPEKAPALVRRLKASKPVALRKVDLSANDSRGDELLASACAQEVQRCLAASCRTIAVVLNRVDRALAAYRRLADELRVPVELMTGRMRPAERDSLVDKLLPRIATGHPRTDSDAPLVVVATQCIEAGADLDFDALVTECASIDALVQRFGRLDRSGELNARGTTPVATIVVRATDLAAGSADPVYGEALRRTWHALEATQDPDFGVSAFPDGWLGDPDLRAPVAAWPVLFPAHLDAWVQTKPRPDPDPDPAAWLHGLQEPERDVTVVWRADLTEALLRASIADEGWLENIRRVVTAIPPAAVETLSVPAGAVRRWLQAGAPAEIADVVGRGEETDTGDSKPAAGRPAVEWHGDESRVIGPADLRPGQLLMVPSTYGGIGSHGSWDQEAVDPVADIAESAQLLLRRRPVLRLLPGVVPVEVALPDPVASPDTSAIDLVRDWLEQLPDREWAAERPHLAQTIELLAKMRSSLVVEPVRTMTEDRRPLDGFIVTSRRPVDIHLLSPAAEPRSTSSETVDSEPETSSFTGAPTELDSHLDGVGRWARRLATNCGLGQAFVEDLELAGRLHDAGKADRRFQEMLRGDGPSDDESILRPSVLWAKSALPANDRGARIAAQSRSTYPMGARHELMSLALIEHVDPLRDRAHDWDLVCHLVASHHGWCRPFAPAVAEHEPVEVALTVLDTPMAARSDHRLARLDSGVADRFWRLVRRYGWFRLAWFEAILRLADHRESELEQRQPDTAGVSKAPSDRA